MTTAIPHLVEAKGGVQKGTADNMTERSTQVNKEILMKDGLHVHYWIHTGQEINLDDDSIVYLYRCSACDKVKRQ